MKLIITIIFLIAITMASSITLIMNNIAYEGGEQTPLSFESEKLSTTEEKELFRPSTRVSRFLAENKNPRAANQCKKDKDICYKEGGYSPTCCNNKCVDLWNNVDNCGECKYKCKGKESCCSGKCVNLSNDSSNCNSCGNKCAKGLQCSAGMCDYAY